MGAKGIRTARHIQGHLCTHITYAAGAWASRITKTDREKLASMQRAALIVTTRAYNTVSGPALLLIAGVPHIQQELERAQLTQKIRNNTPTVIGGIEYDPNSTSGKELKERLKANQEVEHQTRWQEDTRGRTTYEFFPTVKGRREAHWVTPSYYITQFLSGHGNFRAKLRKFSLVPSELCRCGQQDTSRHTFYECPVFEETR